jgi:hypothetical protein
MTGVFLTFIRTRGIPRDLELMSKTRCCIAILLFCFAAFGEQNGRFAVLKEQGFVLFERGQYKEMAGKLEEVWENDQSDPKVAEYLAMGYLYGEKSASKAEPVMLIALDKGGQATFLMQHSHERALTSSGVMNNYCSGKMIVHKGKLSFVADKGEHSFEFSASEASGLKPLGGSPGRFQFQQERKNVVFRVKTETRDEVDLFGRVLKQALK